MKQNKKMLYILAPLVLLIWGSIFYKVFYGEGEAAPMNSSYVDKEVVSTTTDRFQLLINYKDPFLGKKVKRQRRSQLNGDSGSSGRSVKSLEVKPSAILKPNKPVQFPNITYQGYLHLKTNSPKAIIVVDNVYHQLPLGGLVDEVQLKGVWADSVQVVKEDVVRTILFTGG